MDRKEKVDSEVGGWKYLWYALYAFAILGLEVALVIFVEPILFDGVNMGEYSSMQKVIHWLLTILCWGSLSFLLASRAEKVMHFSVWNREKPQRIYALISIVLIIVCVVMDVFSWGTLKTIAEFHSNGLFLFLFQYLYYFIEVVPVLLIIIFGQKFVEEILKKKSKIPWGGVILGCTWGAVHILTQGSIETGISVMMFSLIFGEIYLLLNRNTKWSYLAVAVAFML